MFIQRSSGERQALGPHLGWRSACSHHGEDPSVDPQCRLQPPVLLTHVLNPDYFWDLRLSSGALPDQHSPTHRAGFGAHAGHHHHAPRRQSTQHGAHQALTLQWESTCCSTANNILYEQLLIASIRRERCVQREPSPANVCNQSCPRVLQKIWVRHTFFVLHQHIRSRAKPGLRNG